MAVIEVNHITKEYRLGQLKGLKQTIRNLWDKTRGREVVEKPLFKALDDVSFNIEKGEVVGIIGHNGAGKSTLLKMLARISVPTHGSVKVEGRVAPLIEVGAGLVPDLTGRENIYLNGTILGMSRSELESKIDEIIKFAELEEFIDTPVKRYSSGMKVRLGFSIATSIEAEVLIIDEVLAVGDLAFQRKCFSRMEELIRGRRSTVLIVSHNIRQIERMCSRVIIFSHGEIKGDGAPSEMCDRFYELSNKRVQGVQSKVQSTGEVELKEIDIVGVNEKPVEQIFSGNCLRIRVLLDFKENIVKPEIVIGTHTTDFVYLTSSSTAVLQKQSDYTVGLHEFVYEVDSFQLVAGQYCVRVAVFDQFRRTIYSGETLKTFYVEYQGLEALEPKLRILNAPSKWCIDGQKILRKDRARLGLDLNLQSAVELK